MIFKVLKVQAIVSDLNSTNRLAPVGYVKTSIREKIDTRTVCF